MAQAQARDPREPRRGDRSAIQAGTVGGPRQDDVPTAMLRDLARPIDHAILHAGLTKEALAILERAPIKRLTFEVKIAPKELVAQIAGWETRRRFSELTAMVHHRTAQAWANDALWLLAFDELAPVKRLGIMRFSGDRVVVERGKRGGLVVEIDAKHDGTIVGFLRGKVIEKLVVRGTPQPWSKPSAAFAPAIKKLSADAVELHDGWQPFDPRR